MLIDVNRLYSPKEIIVANGGILPISISAVYTAIRNKSIPVKTIGNRKLIPGTFLKEILEGPSSVIDKKEINNEA